VNIIVIGGGAIGLAVAWRSRQAGHAVRVIDPQPGAGASWAAAGMLAPVTEAHYGEEALLALNLSSAKRWPQFAAELTEAAGQDPGYRTAPTISVARDLDDNAALAELHSFQQRLGLTVQRLTSAELRAEEPTLAPRVRGGLLAVDDHQVDNRALVDALLAACANSGVTVDRRSVDHVACDETGVHGVTVEQGERLAADAVVLCAGYATGRIEGLPPGVLPPIRPVKGQLLHLCGPADAAPRVGAVRGLEVYVVSRGDGRLLVGATMEERGDDRSVTAGAVRELLRAAFELLPGIDEFALVETVAGLRPATPDNAPVLGPTVVTGLHVATGHFRNGILLTPVTADTVAGGLDATPDPLIAPFTADRFTTSKALT
jgi:glycine oxidase